MIYILNNVIIDVLCYFRFHSPLPFVEGRKAGVDECGAVVEGFTIFCVVVFLEGTTIGAFVVVVVVDFGVVLGMVFGVVVVVVDGVVVMVWVGGLGLVTVEEPPPIAAGLELFACG